MGCCRLLLLSIECRFQQIRFQHSYFITPYIGTVLETICSLHNRVMIYWKISSISNTKNRQETVFRMAIIYTWTFTSIWINPPYMTNLLPLHYPPELGWSVSANKNHFITTECLSSRNESHLNVTLHNSILFTLHSVSNYISTMSLSKK